MSDVMWAVLDKNARTGKRIHEAPSGRPYALTNDPTSPTKMPRGDALVFLRDPAFIVFDENGVMQKPLPQAEADRERKVTDLAPDECVARYDELSTPALLARVAARPGGHKIDVATSRGEIIAFLLKSNGAAPAPAANGAGMASIDGQDNLIDDDGDPDGGALGGALEAAMADQKARLLEGE